MIELFQMGSAVYEHLTIELVSVCAIAARSLLNKQRKTSTIKSVGLLAMITGVLGQLIGLFSAFEAIQQMGSVSPGMLAGGLKVSMITTIYGAGIYLISILISIGIKIR